MRDATALLAPCEWWMRPHVHDCSKPVETKTLPVAVRKRCLTRLSLGWWDITAPSAHNKLSGAPFRILESGPDCNIYTTDLALLGFIWLRHVVTCVSKNRVIWGADAAQSTVPVSSVSICVFLSHHRSFTGHEVNECWVLGRVLGRTSVFFFLLLINIITSRHDETAERCERFMSPRFVTTKLPVPRHHDDRAVFNPFSELPLLAVLARQ